MRNIRKWTALTLAALLLAALFSGCAEEVADPDPAYASYREIPGVTEAEIRAIEGLKAQRSAFSYGMLQSAEAFYDRNGEIDGYAALFCDWLTGLFDIPFEPVIVEWGELIGGLETGAIDFTGELTPTEERRGVYHMTDDIAARQMIVVRMAGSAPPGDIGRPPRYCFLEGAITAEELSAHIEDEFEALLVNSYEAAYAMLKSGEADAFLSEGPTEAAFALYSDVQIEIFYPLIYSPVSFATRKGELEPVISVVRKALEHGANRHLAELYNQGHREYNKHKLYMTLTEQEREYIRTRQTAYVAAETGNYPVSFYNARDGRWEGIAIDVLHEVEELTGLTFEIINSPDDQWPELFGALESGRASVITELIRTAEREGRYLWPDVSYMTDNFALISKTEHHNITVNEILYVTVGIGKGTAHGDLFKSWFPNQRGIVEYESTQAALSALGSGEVDMAMASLHQLLILTNYREQVGYKANLVFDTQYEYTFGLNKDETVLCSIMDKAMRLADIDAISGQWLRRTYDYRVKLEQARTPWLIGAIVLLFSLAAVFFVFQQRLTKAVASAEAANRTKSTFLANMSHEIRTPMNAIIGMSELLMHEQLNERQSGYTEDINRSAYSLLSIINDILDMSKIESGKLELMPVDYDFHALLNSIRSMFSFVAQKKGVEFRFERRADVPRYLYGDDIRLKQVLSNICGNAVKFTEQGYVSLKVSGAGETLILEVKDTGRGIKQDDIPKLFDEFQQSDTLKNRGIVGSGLGLSISKSFVDMMGGKIMIDSVYGSGTVFSIVIPLVLGDRDKVKSQSGETEQTLCAPDANILVVDDNEFNLKVAYGLLKLSKIEAKTASGGREALQMVQQNDYDLVFIDHMMPDMDGLETVAAIRALGGKYGDLTLIALTANAVHGAREMFLAHGFNGFVSKPIERQALTAVLKEWLPAEKQQDDTVSDKPEPEIKPEPEPKTETDFFLDTLIKLGIDVKLGMARLSDQREIYQEFVTGFHQSLPEQCKILEDAMTAGDIPSFAITVHALKSALGTIGAMDLAAEAAELEAAAKNEDAGFCEAEFPSFHQKLLTLYGQMSAAFPPETGKKPGDPAALLEGVAKALAATDNFDSSGGVKTLRPLLAFDFGQEINALLEEAVGAFQASDTGAALGALEQICARCDL